MQQIKAAKHPVKFEDQVDGEYFAQKDGEHNVSTAMSQQRNNKANSVDEKNKPPRQTMLKSSQKKTPYKLFSKQQGAFAFQSEESFMQPFYPLRFEEYDLAYQLEREELDERIKTKKGDTVALAMRHKLKQTVT